MAKLDYQIDVDFYRIEATEDYIKLVLVDENGNYIQKRITVSELDSKELRLLKAYIEHFIKKCFNADIEFKGGDVERGVDIPTK